MISLGKQILVLRYFKIDKNIYSIITVDRKSESS